MCGVDFEGENLKTAFEMKNKTTAGRVGLLVMLFVASKAMAMSISVDEQNRRYTIEDSGGAVLTYNFGTIPVPSSATGKYAVARSNYIHPLYGPNGEVLTKDYPPDHPHHRGLYWAWPEVTWKGDKRDLHALQGVFARPVKMIRQAAGVLEAENVWNWGDEEPIVRERAIITVLPEKQGLRIIDLEFRFDPLVDGVTIGRRRQDAYGGFSLRCSAREQQKIVTNRAWAVISGIPPAGKEMVSVGIIQSAGNPEFPGDWYPVPKLDWLQPTFPSKGKAYELKPGAPLLLKYRLVVGVGELDSAVMEKIEQEGRNQ